MASQTCIRCRVKFNNWAEYHTHNVTNTCYKKIVPENTSGRTREQIVRDWEYKNHAHLIY